MIQRFSPYLASWEHLYLMPGGAPAGLPNQIFGRDPWIIVLFEKLYCDVNGLKGEDNANRLLGWTNSELFLRLVENGILEPLPTAAHVRPKAILLRESFTKTLGILPEEAASTAALNVTDFFAWRGEILRDFLEQNELILYDFDLLEAGSSPKFLDVGLTAALEQLEIPMRIASVTQSPSQLPEPLRALFFKLQDFEKEPLVRLRTGALDQLSYLGILQRRAEDYAVIDAELRTDLNYRWDRLLLVRQRFGERGGWAAVTDLLAAHSRAAPPDQIATLQADLREKLEEAHNPFASEFRPGLIEIARALASLIGAVHIVEVGAKVGREAEQLSGVVKEKLKYLRRRFFR